MKTIQFLIALNLLILASCATQRVSTATGGEYNKDKNRTEYFVFPFGTTSISGKWTKTDYIQV